ncbi:MAG: class I SAM-dependent methyltransferase [Candidatus Binatia bacterium]
MFSSAGDGHFIRHGYEDVYRTTVDNATGGLALDVGCGTGKHSVNLARRGFRTVAIDLSLKAVMVAKEHAESENVRVYFVVADAENMPFKDDAFDVVFCALILHHFPDMKAISAEIARVAKGYLFALETNALEPLTFLKFNVVNPILKPKFMTPNQRALFPKKLKSIFENKGFSGFDFSWIDIHVGYKGLVGAVTRVYTEAFKFLPKKNRSNKFIMACRKTERTSADAKITEG